MQWEADFWQGVLVITDPQGNARQVKLVSTGTGRNVTKEQFNSAVKSHGFDRACQTFWKLGV